MTRLRLVTRGAVLAGLLAAQTAGAADPTAGKAVFTSQCLICHSLQPGRNMTGPALFSLVGRTSGAVAGFSYSAANRDANIVWDAATLDRYLKAPMMVIPGTTMAYAGLADDTRRANLIAYLATLK